MEQNNDEIWYCFFFCVESLQWTFLRILLSALLFLYSVLYPSWILENAHFEKKQLFPLMPISTRWSIIPSRQSVCLHRWHALFWAGPCWTNRHITSCRSFFLALLGTTSSHWIDKEGMDLEYSQVSSMLIVGSPTSEKSIRSSHCIRNGDANMSPLIVLCVHMHPHHKTPCRPTHTKNQISYFYAFL